MAFRRKAALFCITFYACLGTLEFLILHALSNHGSELELSLNASILNILLVLTIASHLRAVFINPGIVPKPAISIDFSCINKDVSTKSSWLVCRACAMFVHPNSRHCTTCNGCVLKSRGHWSLLNTCVGYENYKFLLQFLLWSCVTGGYCFVTGWYSQQYRIAITLISTMIMLLSTVFLAKEVVHIKSISKEDSVHITLNQVFGRGQKWFWLFPCSSSISSKPGIAVM